MVAVEPFELGGADAWDFFDGQWVGERGDLFWPEDVQAVGFIEIGGDLGEHGIGREADGGDQTGALEDGAFEVAGDVEGVAEQAFGAGDVESCFIDGQGLNAGGELVEGLEDLAGDFTDAMAWDFDASGVGAEPERGGGGHGTAAAELSGLVGRGGDDASGPGAAGEDGQAFEGGVIKHGDGGEERVHVDMEDGAWGGPGWWGVTWHGVK